MSQKGQYDQVIDLVESPRFGTFTKWEQDFLIDIYYNCDLDYPISEKQKNCIENIYKKYFG